MVFAGETCAGHENNLSKWVHTILCELRNVRADDCYASIVYKFQLAC